MSWQIHSIHPWEKLLFVSSEEYNYNLKTLQVAIDYWGLIKLSVVSD